MSAERNASTLLIAMVGTIILFAAFAMVIRLPILAKHSYDLGYGWQAKKPAIAPAGECDRALTTKGFPAMTQRPDANDPTGCGDEVNVVAGYMNLAICFAAAAIIGVGAASAVRH